MRMGADGDKRSVWSRCTPSSGYAGKRRTSGFGYTMNTTSVPCWIKGDGTQIRQVLVNPVTNARDAMPEGGKLSISVSDAKAADVQEFADLLDPEKSFVCLVLSDTGRGDHRYCFLAPHGTQSGGLVK